MSSRPWIVTFLAAAIASAALTAAAPQGGAAALKNPAGLKETAPATFKANFDTSVGPFVVDTTQSRLDGTGTISFPSEALAIRLTGAPKERAVLRLPGSATMTGTISEPNIVVPKEVKSIGNIFKAIGRAITGRQGPTAQDADCSGLAARVLR